MTGKRTAKAGALAALQKRNRRVGGGSEKGKGRTPVSAQPVQIGRLSATATGLELDDTVDVGYWQKIGEDIGRVNGALNWIIGDWLRYPDGRGWGDMYAVAEEVTKLENGSLRHLKACAVAYADSPRYAEISWTHHNVIRGIKPDVRDDLLKQAINNGWSVKALKTAAAKLLGGPEEADELEAKREKVASAISSFLADLKGAKKAAEKKKLKKAIEEA